MAFLDNSGDIIVDAVLTDEGRRRLALGDGSFRITKFALGDDEIDYALFETTPASGSAYEDTRILQLPVFEAFTNNTTSLKNRLLTYDNLNLLYLPEIKLNTKFAPTTSDGLGPVGGYYVSVDETTNDRINNLEPNGINSLGYRIAAGQPAASQTRLIFDQGLDTAAFSLGYLRGGGNAREGELFESGYLVEVDSRLLGVTDTTPQANVATPSFIDDDNIATYFFSLGDQGAPYFASQGRIGDGTQTRGGTASPAFAIPLSNKLGESFIANCLAKSLV